ncbi:hypothetical protein [Christiangramia portivictoriae]|uniref:hypothetical protein n=1 Tax=Christiangramia portivictoriae TaxID=326069 RepID=UPI0003FFD843|nr:hypothetical protein [Christiangramia portivictoriae]
MEKPKAAPKLFLTVDIILKMIKEPKFADNNVYWNKNQYTQVPLETLRFNIAGGYVYNPEGEPEPEEFELKT